MALTDKIANVEKYRSKLHFLIQVFHEGVTIHVEYQRSHWPPRSI